MLTPRHRFSITLSYWFPIVILPILAILAGCSSSGTIQRPSKSMSDTELTSMAKGIHERVLTIDTHDDISGDFASEKDDESSPDNRRQVTLYKIKQGGLDVEFFAAFTGNGPRTPDAFESAYKRAVSLFDAIHRLPDRYPELVDIAYSPDDVTRIHASGKRVACIGMENGYPVGTDLAKVKEFYVKNQAGMHHSRVRFSGISHFAFRLDNLVVNIDETDGNAFARHKIEGFQQKTAEADIQDNADTL